MDEDSASTASSSSKKGVQGDCVAKKQTNKQTNKEINKYTHTMLVQVTEEYNASQLFQGINESLYAEENLHSAVYIQAHSSCLSTLDT